MASEEFASKAQIKRLYAVLYSLGSEPKEWKKDHNIASYAKLTPGQCSGLIDELELEEAEKKGKHQEAVKQNKEDVQNGTQQQFKGPGDVSYDQEGFVQDQTPAEAEISKIAVVMKFAAVEAKHIVDDLANGGGITEGTKASLTERFAVTIFIEAMRRGL